MHFDLADLRLFLAVADAGSITHGAAAANLSLAAASERLRAMEAGGGVRLFDRGRRGVTPTRAGEALAHHARIVLGQVAALRAELSEFASGIRGSVRLLANSAAIAHFLPAPLGTWLAANPGLDVVLAERPSAEIVTAVAGGLADLGIVSDAVATGALETAPFAIDHLVAVMAPDHRLAGEPELPLARLIDEDHVGFAGALQQHIDEQAARLGARLRLRVRLTTFEGVCRAAAQGAGLGIVPEAAARQWRSTLKMAAVPLADPWARRDLLLCWRSADVLDPGAATLAAHLRRPAGPGAALP